MKRKLSILLIAIIVLNGFGATVALGDQSDTFLIQDNREFSAPVLIDQDRYLSVRLAEATSYATLPGHPVLPMYTTLFTFPFGTTIKNVSFTSSSIQTIELTKEILPADQPAPVSLRLDKFLCSKHVKNDTIYLGEQPYPSSRLNYQLGSGLKGNDRVVLLSVQYYPLLYVPHQRTLLFTPDVQITVTYEPSKNPLFLSNDTRLLIIAPEEFTAALQPLVSHKNHYEIQTTLITAEWIAEHSFGRDHQEQIKYAIKEEIENSSITSVLLVGGVDALPIRRSYVMLWDRDFQVITDLYYSDIYDADGNFSSWDTNNNDKFGEPSDHVDIYPDVHLGRLACSSVDEVSIVVDKIIQYETQTYGSDWFQSMIFIGGNTFRWTPGNDGEQNNQILMEIMSEFTPKLIWTSLGNFDRQTISTTINEGAGFLDYSGHGFEHGMGTYTPRGLQMKYYFTRYIKDLQNGYKLPIMFFDACLTAKIDFVFQDLLDYRIYFVFNLLAKIFNIDTSKRLPCYAWAFVNHTDGGAIASIGATRIAYGGIDSGAGKMSIEFFSAYADSKYLGQMMTQMQNSYITDVPKDPFTVEEFILLGDPTLMIGGYPS